MIVGCDPSTKRCALADTTGRCTSVLLYPKDDNSKRLALSYRQIELFAKQFCQPVPVCVVVEQASGVPGHVSRQLVEMVGVTRGAIYSALERPGPCDVFLMPPSMWKKATVGKGNASHEQYVEWAREQGAHFSNEDEAAAYCIARAGEALLT